MAEEPKELHEDPLEGFLSRAIDRFAHIAMTLVVDLVAVMVALAILFIVFELGRGLVDVFSGGGMEAVLGIIEGALTVLVFIEIFEAFISYMREKRLNVRLVLDLSLIIVLREVWLASLSHSPAAELLAYAALIVAIGAIRVAMGISHRAAVEAGQAKP